MDQEIKEIKFDNRKKPNVRFDILGLEDIFTKRNLDHSPLQAHRVDFFLILFITKGIGQHTIDFTNYSFKEGTVLTIRRNQIHRFFKNNAKGYVLLFTDDFLIQYLEPQEAIKTVQLFNELLGSPKIELEKTDYTAIFDLISQINTEYNAPQDPYSLGIIRSLLHVLISKLYRAKSKAHLALHNKKYLKTFIAFQELVEEQCFKTKRVKDYANSMGLSTKTLNNVVRSILNKSAKTFIDEIVILRIKRLLINTPMTVKEIAYMVGFEDPSNLYKYFKRFANTSPEVFRQANSTSLK